MRISLIVAMSSNRVIGAAGRLPWHLPADLQRFKQLTMGQTLLMGRKTFESIGRPLPGRQTIVVSHNPEFHADGCQIVTTLQSGITAVRSNELFICGGGEIYRQTLPLVEIIYLTEVLREFSGDSFFPEIPARQFQSSHSEEMLDGGERCRFSILHRCY
jgi:dihydrofolate reductase